MLKANCLIKNINKYLGANIVYVLIQSFNSLIKMETSQLLSASERIGLIQDLMEEVLTIEKEGESSLERVKEIIKTSGNIVEVNKFPSEMIIDGKILSSGGNIVRNHVQKFETNLTIFSPDEYTSGVISYVKNNSSENEMDWEILAAETFSMFKKIPVLDFRLGTFQLDPPPLPEKSKIERQKKANSSAKTIVSAVTEKNEESDEPKDEIYQHILRCMVRIYKSNNRQPIEYFKFIIDPTDFWTSVQNIFHFSFLVRDAKVKMSINDKGLPVVEPLLSSKESDNAKTFKSSQFAFRITPPEWRKFIDVFQITDAAITPFNKK